MSSSRNAPVPPPLQPPPQGHEPLKTVRVDRSMIPDLDAPPPVAPPPHAPAQGGGARTMVLPRYEPPEESALNVVAGQPVYDDLDGPTMAVPRFEPSLDAPGVPPVGPPMSTPPPGPPRSAPQAAPMPAPSAPPASSAPPRFAPFLDAPDALGVARAPLAGSADPYGAPPVAPAPLAHAVARAPMGSPFPRAEGEEDRARAPHATPHAEAPRAPVPAMPAYAAPAYSAPAYSAPAPAAPTRPATSAPAAYTQAPAPAAFREGHATAETALIPRPGRRRPGRASALPLAHDLLRTIVDLGRADVGTLPPVGAIEAQLRGAVERFRATASEAGHPTGDIEDMSYALVAFADESLLSRSDELRDQWAGRLLQIAFFRENTAGEGFFSRLEALLPDRTRRPVLEVYGACLLLGFRGRYAVRGGDAELQGHVESVRRVLQLGPDALDVPLSPRPYVPPPLLARGGGSWLARAALIVLTLAVALYVGLQIDLSARAAALADPDAPADLEPASLAPRRSTPLAAEPTPPQAPAPEDD